MLIYLMIDFDQEKNKRFSLMFVDGDMWIAFRDKFLDGTKITPESVSRMMQHFVDNPMTSEVFRAMYIGNLSYAIEKDSPVICGIGWYIADHPDHPDHVGEGNYSDRIEYVRWLIRNHDDYMIIYSYIDSLEKDFPWCMPADVIKWWCDTAPQPE